MTDADPFLEAIRANPDDDLPRLVYADWLDERGEATYAEFIRLDCRLARREPQSPLERGRLRQRRNDLRTRLAREWKEAIGEGGEWMLFQNRRGLFEPTVYIDGAGEFLRRSPHWWPRFLVERLYLKGIDGYADEIAAAPYMSRVRVLGVGQPRETDNGRAQPDELLGSIAGANQFERLEAFEYGPVRASRRSLRKLTQAVFLRRLDKGGMFIRVLLSDELTSDGRFVFADIENPSETARAAVERFIGEYGNRLPGN